MKRACLLSLALIATPVWAAEEPVDAFFDRAAREWMRADPQRATAQQFFEGAEQDALDRQLTPATIAYKRGRIPVLRRNLEELRRFEHGKLSPDQRISYASLAWQLQEMLREEPFLQDAFPFEQFGGVQRRLVDFFSNTHPLRNARDAENFLARLDQFGPVLDGALADARAQGRRGVLPPAFIISATIGQMERFVVPTPEKNLLVTSLGERLARVETVGTAQREQFVAAAAKVVGASIYPAWQRVLVLLRDQLSKAKDDAGLWRLPKGDAAYRAALRRYTTTALTPDQVHALGLQQVARLETEMDGLLKALGYTAGSVNERMAKLVEDAPPPPSPDQRAWVLAEYERVIRDAEARCAALFNLRPKAPVVVRREPEFSEANAAAHYTPPARDGSLPGTFWAPLPGPSFRVSRTLAYHEAVPGHHFQIALQQEFEHLPRFRRDRVFLGLSAYTEGWGLYAEHLAAEEGWYEGDARGRLGQLNAELFRARRLVVDTGLHAKHWTRQQAIDYGMPVSEVERYVVLPGQACSYMVGELRIIALRDKMRTALGERYSLRAFHDVILRTGSVPLDVLEQAVDDAIAAERQGAAPAR